MAERASGPRAAAACAVVVLIVYALSCSASVSVSLLSSVKEVAPGAFVTAVFAVKNGGIVTATFLLTFDTPLGWGVHGAPGSITLSPGEEESLFATITVPPATSAGQYEIGFTAVSESDPTDGATVTATIAVSPLNEVGIIPPAGKSGVPGRAIEYEATIVNRGNVQDSFVIEARSSGGFPVMLAMGSVDLAPQERIRRGRRRGERIDGGPPSRAGGSRRDADRDAPGPAPSIDRQGPIHRLVQQPAQLLPLRTRTRWVLLSIDQRLGPLRS